jgi:hypothetical protein
VVGPNGALGRTAAFKLAVLSAASALITVTRLTAANLTNLIEAVEWTMIFWIFVAIELRAVAESGETIELTGVS